MKRQKPNPTSHGTLRDLKLSGGWLFRIKLLFGFLWFNRLHLSRQYRIHWQFSWFMCFRPALQPEEDNYKSWNAKKIRIEIWKEIRIEICKRDNNCCQLGSSIVKIWVFSSSSRLNKVHVTKKPVLVLVLNWFLVIYNMTLK